MKYRGLKITSLFLMAHHAKLDRVLCNCVFIPFWGKIDPVSTPFFFWLNVSILEELTVCMITIQHE